MDIETKKHIDPVRPENIVEPPGAITVNTVMQPKQKPPKDKRKRLIFVIIGGAVLLIASLILLNKGFLPLIYQSEELNSACSLTNQSQSSYGFRDNLIKYRTGPYEGKDGKITARVLSSSPIILEILNTDPVSDFPSGDLGLQEFQFADQSQKAILHQLKFNDFIEAKTKGFTYEAQEELAFGQALTDIRKVSKSTAIAKSKSIGYRYPSGTLIRYTSKAGQLQIFNDGKIYYRDNAANEFTNQSLDEAKLKALLKVFGDSNFDKLPSTESNIDSSNSVSLMCARFQNVSVDTQKDQLKAVTTKLDEIINGLDQRATLRLTFETKSKITTKEWPYSQLKLANLKQAHDSALATYRSTGKVDENSVVYTQLSPEFLNQVPANSGTSEQNLQIYFTEESKLYLVSKGYNSCVTPPLACKANTFYILTAQEIKEPSGDDFGSGVKLWPKTSKLDLASASSKSITISDSEYKSNKQFYDVFFKSLRGDATFVQNGYLFEKVAVSKEE